MSYVVIDGCPAPERLEPLLREIKAAIGCTYQSIYRGSDAEKLLKANGKHSQAFLFDGFRRGLPGFNPANPPGQSTHELRSDAVAYAGPVGRQLRWWQVGIDVDDAHVAAFISAAAQRGWTAHITYPTSRLEYHHVNLVKAPKISAALWWKWRPIRRGARAVPGTRGRWVVKTLRFLESPRDHKRYLHPHGKPPRTITSHVAGAIAHFQRDHHQHADGVVGLHTMRQMRAAKRSQTRKRKAKEKR